MYTLKLIKKLIDRFTLSVPFRTSLCILNCNSNVISTLRGSIEYQNVQSSRFVRRRVCRSVVRADDFSCVECQEKDLCCIFAEILSCIVTCAFDSRFLFKSESLLLFAMNSFAGNECFRNDPRSTRNDSDATMNLARSFYFKKTYLRLNHH